MVNRNCLSLGSIKLPSTNLKQLGVERFLEDDAQFQNGFGAMSHVQVVCDYDFGAGTVVNVKINQ